MIRSMTGYGRGEYSLGDQKFVVEIKTVNNRYRDIIVRLPKSLQALEDPIRSQVSSAIRRGRVEVFVQVERQGGERAAYALELNMPLVRSYMDIFRQLDEAFGVGRDIRPHELCQMRDVIGIKPEEMDLDEIQGGIREAARLALDSCDAMRCQEGHVIEEDFQRRLALIETHLQEVKERVPLVVEAYRKRLQERIDQISHEIEVDEGRLAQEVALFADRCDIAEEILRGRSHLKQFRHYMAEGGAIGRRLEFLLQEIHREANTVSAKASDSFISAKTVEIKAQLEKLREQVQNVE